MNKNLQSELLKGAMTTGFINALINGGIQYFFLKDKVAIAITVDSITSTEETVLGTAVVLAITLSMILTLVAYFGIKEKKSAFFSHYFVVNHKTWFLHFWNHNFIGRFMAKVYGNCYRVVNHSATYYRRYSRTSFWDCKLPYAQRINSRRKINF